MVLEHIVLILLKSDANAGLRRHMGEGLYPRWTPHTYWLVYSKWYSVSLGVVYDALKSADALPIENERINVAPCQISPLRPYVYSPIVDPSSSSSRPQSPTPDLVLVAKSPLKETDRYAYVEIEDTPSRNSSVSERQVEQAVLCDYEGTPLANCLDSSGETLVENANLSAAQEEPR